MATKTKTLSDEELLRRLQAHPELRNRIESLILVVENAAGDLKEADAAEMSGSEGGMAQ